MKAVILLICLCGGMAQAQTGLQLEKLKLPALPMLATKEMLERKTSSVQGVVSLPQKPFALPLVPLGFFCKFEDKLQRNWKIPVNFELQ